MKKLILFLTFAMIAFAQRGGGGSASHSAPPSAPAPAAPHFSMPAPPPQQHFSTPAPQPRFASPQQNSPQNSRQNWNRFGQPGPGPRPGPGQPGRPPIRPRPPVVIVHPGNNEYYGFGGWNYYFDLGFWPYYYPYPWYYYGPYGIDIAPAYQAQPCMKKTLKGSNGLKHDILVCVQPDGTMRVVADSDATKMIPVPKSEVKHD